MTRRLGPIAVGALAVTVAMVILVALGEPSPTPAEEADALARQLRCPDCQGLSVADSPTESAAEIRRQIDAMLASGSSAADVRAHFVERYGEWILLAPASPVVWLVPLVVVVIAAVLLIAWLARIRGTGARGPAAPGEELRRLLHEEADALDA